MKFIVGGSSTTNDQSWPTWATWTKKRYDLIEFNDVSVKGLGNEVILLKTLQVAKQSPDPFLLVQLTSIDKWDWYVEDCELIKLLDNERHPAVRLNSTDDSGFWSTGSHFPRWKEYYYNNYFGVKYFTYKTLLNIHWFQLVCQKNNWQYYILFDSPILSVTENQLNTGKLDKTECLSTPLVENSLCQLIYDQIDWTNIYTPGIIGYACLNDLPWYTKRYKGHPGSLVHYKFFKDIIDPHLSQIIHSDKKIDDFLIEATKYQNLVDA
jgi:hypothetical protein